MKYFTVSLSSISKLVFVVVLTCCLHRQRADGSESAESCSLAGKALEADLNRSPNNVLLIFGDAVRMSPNCLRGLFRIAIRTSRPDEGLLKQMILVAINEYPEETNTIAEVCFEEAPDKANAIKSAFVSIPEPAEKSVKREGKRKSVSPIDRFLQQQQPVEAAVVSTKDEEADRKIKEAVAKMTANLEGESRITPTPKVSLPNALVEEKTVAGKFPTKALEPQVEDKSDRRIGSQAERKKEGRPESFDIIDEITRGRTAETIVIDDRPVANRDEEDLFQDRKMKNSPESKPLPAKAAAPPVRRKSGPPNVYYIPPAAGTGTGRIGGNSESLPNRRSSIILRSLPISPTSPR